MNDLISREAALEAIYARKRMARRDGIKDDEMRPTQKAVREFVQALPAVDAELVRHGTWELVPVGVNGHVKAYHGCSACGCVFKSPSHYCQNCGAKMEET